jgi:hypothetical protein
VANSRAGAHDLHISGDRPSLVAEIVLMADRPFAHVGDDLHVGVGVRREPGTGLNGVVVPDPQRTPMNTLGVVVIGEREMVPGIQPAVIGMAKAVEGTMLDHSGLRWHVAMPA